MTVDSTTGAVGWTPTAAQVGPADVVLRVQDGRGGSALQSFRISVSTANSPPAFTSAPSGPAVVGLPWRYAALALDPDRDPLTYSLSEAPAGMTVDPATGVVSFTPAAGQVGSRHVLVLADDGRGGRATLTFDLPVVAVATNDPPAITSAPKQRVQLGAQYVYAVIASDPNGDPLTYRLESAPTGMAIDATGLITWTPQPADLGQAPPVKLRVEDGRGGFATQEFNVAVVSLDANHPPSISSKPPQAATVGKLYRYDPTAADPDGDPLLWSLDAGPDGMAVDPATGTLVWTARADQGGTAQVVLRVTDARGAFATQTFDVAANAVNLSPAITSVPPTSAKTAAVYSYAVRASDPEGDPLTFSLTKSPAGMTIDAATGAIRWTPTAAQVGLQDVEVRVEDGRGGSATQGWQVLVGTAQPNHPPSITSSPTYYAVGGQAYRYDVDAADPDGDPVTYLLLSGPAGMAIDPTSGLVTWTPPANQTGTFTVSVAAVDPAGLGMVQNYTGVVRTNQPPVFTSTPPASAVPGARYSYGLTASDPDGDTVTFGLSSGPAGMSVDTLGHVTWTPTAAQSGEYPVTVTVTDAFGATATQAFKVTVAADTQAPKVTLQANRPQVAAGDSVTFLVSATDNVGVTDLRLVVNDSPVALDGAGRATVRFDVAGTVDRLKTVSVHERQDQPLATPETTTYRYDKVGNLDLIRQANGVVSDHTYDALNRLSELVHFADTNNNQTLDAGEAVKAKFVYTLNDDGSRNTATETDDEGRTTVFHWAYDGLNRLTSEVRDGVDDASDYIAVYRYDLVGNRLTKETDTHAAASAISTFLTSGSLTPDESVTYTYDDNDRLLTEIKDAVGTTDDTYTSYGYGLANTGTAQTSKTTRSGLTPAGTLRQQTRMEYNLQGRLAAATILSFNPDASIAFQTQTNYVYDNQGIRIEQTANESGTATIHAYLIDPSNPTGYAQVLEENVNAALARTFTLGYAVLAQYDPTNGSVLLLRDGHGSTRSLVSATTGVLQRYAYDAFGNVLVGSGLTSDNTLTALLYSGEQFDAKLGVEYLRARFLDTSSGRFISLDPFPGNVNLPVSLHKYLYANANPVIFIDPSGHFSMAELSVSMAVGGILNAAVNYSANQPLGEIATNFAVGALEWAVSYIAVGALMAGGARLLRFVRVERLGGPIANVFRQVSGASGPIAGTSYSRVFTLETGAGKFLISSSTESSGSITGALKHLVQDVLLKAGDPGKTVLAEALALKELQGVLELAAESGLKNAEKVIVRTGWAEWELMFEVNGSGTIPKLYHAIPRILAP